MRQGRVIWSRSCGLDPTVARLLITGQRHLAALAPEQRAQFVFLQVSLFRNYESPPEAASNADPASSPTSGS